MYSIAMYGDAVVLVDVVDVDDVRVVEQRADPRLVEEHLDDPRIAASSGLSRLMTSSFSNAGHRGLAREVDLRHAADREQAVSQ